jgi:predicted phosphoribosyltransferase
MFRNRVDAGRRLASALSDYEGEKVVIYAIPRGGVVVAYEVANRLDAPIEIVIPRKIRAPNQPELAIGAVTQDGTSLLNHKLISNLDVSEDYLQKEIDIQIEEINRRMNRYQNHKQSIDLKDKIVIVVDDGVATGATLRAAILSIKRKEPKLIVVAVPVGPSDTIKQLEKDADRVVCLYVPEPFFAIGQFYQNFDQTSDEEVIRLLKDIKNDLIPLR